MVGKIVAKHDCIDAAIQQVFIVGELFDFRAANCHSILPSGFHAVADSPDHRILSFVELADILHAAPQAEHTNFYFFHHVIPLL